ALAGEETVGDHAVKARAQLLGRDAREDALQLDEATGPGGEVANDEPGPLVTDQVKGARLRRPLLRRMSFGRRYWRHFSLRGGVRSSGLWDSNTESVASG